MAYVRKPDSLILQPEKTKLLQIFDMLKNVFDAAPENLPAIFVHEKNVWTDPPWTDDSGHLHMCEADFFKLKNMGMPTIHYRTVRDVSCHKIDTGKTFVRELDKQDNIAKNGALLNNLGPQTLEEIDNAAGTKKKLR